MDIYGPLMKNGKMNIRKINKSDNKQLAVMLRRVLTEVGANSEGFAFADPQLDNMFEYYKGQKGSYYILENEQGNIIGAAGFGELAGEPTMVELQKMYFLSEARGKGMAQKMLDMLMDEAKLLGFTSCYLETINTLHAAIKLYERNGFKHVSHACGNTGHFGCNVYMVKTL